MCNYGWCGDLSVGSKQAKACSSLYNDANHTLPPPLHNDAYHKVQWCSAADKSFEKDEPNLWMMAWRMDVVKVSGLLKESFTCRGRCTHLLYRCRQQKVRQSGPSADSPSSDLDSLQNGQGGVAAQPKNNCIVCQSPRFKSWHLQVETEWERPLPECFAIHSRHIIAVFLYCIWKYLYYSIYISPFLKTRSPESRRLKRVYIDRLTIETQRTLHFSRSCPSQCTHHPEEY